MVVKNSKLKLTGKVDPIALFKRKALLEDVVTETEMQMGMSQFMPVDANGTLNIDRNFLSLPKDITVVTSQDMGNYLNAFTQQKMYMRTLRSWQALVVEDSRRAYIEVSGNAYKQLDKKMSETMKERILSVDPQIQDKYYAYLDAVKKQEVLDSVLLSIEDAIFLLSREITRRVGDIADEQRLFNIGK